MKLNKVILPVLALVLAGCGGGTNKNDTPATPSSTTLDNDAEIVTQLLEPFKGMGYYNSVRPDESLGDDALSWTYWLDHEGKITNEDADESVKLLTAFNQSDVSDYKDEDYNNDVTFSYDELNETYKEIFGTDLDMSKVEREGTDLLYDAYNTNIIYDDVENEFLIHPYGTDVGGRWYRMEVTSAVEEDNEIVIQTRVVYEEEFETANPNSRLYADANFTELVDEFESYNDPHQAFTCSLDTYKDVLRTYEWTFTKGDNDEYAFTSVEFLKDEFTGGSVDYHKEVTLDTNSEVVTDLMKPFNDFLYQESFKPTSLTYNDNFTYFYQNAYKDIFGYDQVTDTVKYAMAASSLTSGKSDQSVVTLSASDIQGYLYGIFKEEFNLANVEVNANGNSAYETNCRLTTFDSSYSTATLTLLPQCGGTARAKVNIIEATQSNVIIEGRKREDLIQIKVNVLFFLDQGEKYTEVYADPNYTVKLGQYDEVVTDTSDAFEQYKDSLETYQWTFKRTQKDGKFYFDSVEYVK